MTTKTKDIAGVSFELSTPYVAGHAITEAEAKALNQVRLENIGNNVRAKVKELIDAGNEAAARELVATKDAEYVFTLASVAASAKLSPEEKEARSMARDILRSKLAEAGKKINVAPEGVTQEEWDAKMEANLEKIANDPAIVKAAKKAVAERTSRASSVAAELDI